MKTFDLIVFGLVFMSVVVGLAYNVRLHRYCKKQGIRIQD